MKENTENIYEINPNKGSKKISKRIGRGSGSGRGGTSGKGHKGQRARSGKARPYVGFEGGQRPIYRRLPKRGFFNLFSKKWGIMNLSDLNRFDENTEIDIKFLQEQGYIHKNLKLLKILGNGEIKKKFKIKANKFSENAKKSLTDFGCEIEEIGIPPKPINKIVKKKAK